MRPHRVRLLHHCASPHIGGSNTRGPTASVPFITSAFPPPQFARATSWPPRALRTASRTSSPPNSLSISSSLLHSNLMEVPTLPSLQGSSLDPTIVEPISNLMEEPIVPNSNLMEEPSTDDEINYMYIPTVNEENVPKVGMCFETVDEATNFYMNYSKEGGFGIRVGSSKRKQPTGEFLYILWVCSKEGHYVPKETSTSQEKQRKRKRIREGCKAHLRLKLNTSGKYEVTTFVKEHNHRLASYGSIFITSHRNVTPTKKILLHQMKAANIRTSNCVNLFAVQHGGYDNIGCTEKDIRNFERDMKHQSKENDAQYLLNIFKEKKDMNPSFYYAYEVDDDRKLIQCFWADGYGRKAFSHFNDVLVFDTTYDTNEYNLRFAPFVGINHHGQSIVFGSGLIHKENIESFVWLFEKWLEAMSGRAPNVIITDEDPAMKEAIAISFPQTFHRLCMWHILKKLPDKLGKKDGEGKQAQGDLLKCIWDSESPIEFETKWEAILTTYQPNSHKWLKDKYDIRQKWIPAYAKDIFLGGMRTTQRSESMNAFFDKHLKKRNTLVEFYAHYQLAVKRLKHNELKKDHESEYSKPTLKTQFSMEQQMANVYTHNMFFEFQKELYENMYYVVVLNERAGDVAIYTVKKINENSREVMYNESTQEGSCTCKLFQSIGIPCRHILTILKNYFVEKLPNSCILTRWTKYAKASQVYGIDGVELQEDCNARSGLPYSETTKIFSRCIHKASKSVVAQKLLHEGLASLEEQIDMLESSKNPSNDYNQDIIMSISKDPNVHPPDKSRTKGCGKRIIGDKEKAIVHANKGRICRGCNQRVVDHDKRNCPTLKSLQSTQVESQASAPTII